MNNIRNTLYGPNAFYNQEDYLKTSEVEFSAKKVLPPIYKVTIENSIVRKIKLIVSIFVFPIGIYQLLHILAANIFLPSINPALLDTSKERLDKIRVNILSRSGEWKYKRLSIEVDGYTIDAMIMGKASTFNNGRWCLASGGNGEFYEKKLGDAFQHYDFKELLSELQANAIVFNYPGVVASSGMPSRGAMEKAYKAMLTFLEDQNNGIGAKEIIGYGHSIGGAAQGEALNTHKLKEDVKYVFVKGRTFSHLHGVATSFTNRIGGILTILLGWNMSSVASSKKLQAPEIIIQTAKVNQYEELQDSEKIIDDGIIDAKYSLAKELLDDPNCSKKNKVFIGIPEGHNARLSNKEFLAKKIEELLKVKSEA